MSAVSDGVESRKILEGTWDEGITWEFYLDEHLPPRNLCTAVVSLAILPGSEEIVLARNYRGWEMPGGHIEDGESLEDALIRESLEEGGFTPEASVLFGYRKLTASKLGTTEQGKTRYPFPSSFIPHYISISRLPLQEPSGDEIFDRQTVPFSQVESVNIVAGEIAKVGLELYHAKYRELLRNRQLNIPITTKKKVIGRPKLGAKKNPIFTYFLDFPLFPSRTWRKTGFFWRDALRFLPKQAAGRASPSQQLAYFSSFPQNRFERSCRSAPG